MAPASGLDLAYYRPVVQVLLGYVALTYVFLYAQAGYTWVAYFREKAKDPSVKFNKIKYGASPDKLVFERTVGNLMEQAVPFLVALLLSAAFGDDVLHSAQLGWLYIGFRAFYPFVFKRGLLVVLVTVPNYFTIAALLWTVIKRL